MGIYMFDKIKENKLCIISVLTIIFALLVIVSFIVPTFGCSNRQSHAIRVIVSDLKYSWNLIFMNTVLIFSPFALLINLKFNDNNSRILQLITYIYVSWDDFAY